MSESSKMGLFGSKDDNTDAVDEKNEAARTSESTSESMLETSAPYNIDSDSETYDTEALSIMDINDIIGVQTESASDSTLESEFAALSEVITDIKSDEIAAANVKAVNAKENTVGRSDRNRDFGSTEDKGSEKDSPKDDIRSQADGNKFSDSASMAGINKSLQLIGEYSSDESQDVDTETPGTSVAKSENISESLGASKNEAAAKDSSEKVACCDEQIAPKQIIADEISTKSEEDATSDKSVETAMKPMEENLKSVAIEKSTDSTDFAADVSSKQFEEENKTMKAVEEDLKSVTIDKSTDSTDSAADVSTKQFEEENKTMKAVEEDLKSVAIEISTDSTDSAADVSTKQFEEENKTMKAVEEDLKSVTIDKSTDSTDSAADVSTKQFEEENKTMKAVEEDLKSVAIEKSTDSTDSAADVSTKQFEEENKTMKAVEEDLKSVAIEKSTDSTDSAADVSTKQFEEENKTESMDVDSTVSQNVTANVLVEKPACNKPEENDNVEKVIEDSKTDIAVDDTEYFPDEPIVQVEEPMEVCQPNEEVSDKVESEKTDPVVTENVLEDKPGPLDPVVAAEGTIVSKTVSQPEESEQSIDEVPKDATFSPGPEISEESLSGSQPEESKESIDEVPKDAEVSPVPEISKESLSVSQPEESKESIDEIPKDAEVSPVPEISEESLSNQVAEAEASNFVPEESEAPKIVEDELKESSDSSREDENVAEKLEMETDDSQVEESLAEKVEANNSAAKVVESVGETAEEDDTKAEDDKPETLSINAEVEQEMSPESREQAIQFRKSDVMLVDFVQVQHKNEPMEVDDNTGYHNSQSDKEGVNNPDSSDNLVDTVAPIADVVVPLKQSNNDEPVDTASSSRVDSSENPETSEIPEALSDSTVKDGAKKETVVTSYKSVSNVTNVTKVRLEYCEYYESEESSAMDEAMETEDITLKESCREEFAVSTPELAENSLEAVETVPNVVEDTAAVEETATVEETAAVEETAVEDDKMEVDAGVKRKKEKDEESEICGPDEATQEAEKSPISVEQKADAVEEKPTTEKAGDSDEIEMTENAGKSAEETIEIPSDSVTSESSENKTALSIDETDEAKQETKEAENAALIVLQNTESLATKIDETVLIDTETPENATAKVVEDEEEAVKSESKEDGNEIPGVISESSTEVIPEVEIAKAKEISSDVDIAKSNESMDESAENEEDSIKPAAEEAELLILTEKAESSTDKVDEIEASDVPEEDSIKPAAEEAELLILSEKAKSSTDRVDEIETSEVPEEATEEDVKEGDNNTQPEVNENETVLLASTEKSESSTGSNEEKILEAPLPETVKNVEDEKDEPAAITKEEEESKVSGEKLEPSSGSRIEIAETSDATIVKCVEDEKEESPRQLKESTIPADNSIKTTQEIQSSETDNIATINDVKEEDEESKSQLKEAEKKSPTHTEATAEVPEESGKEFSQKDAEESAPATIDEVVESHSAFPVPDAASRQETSRSDLSSSSINPDDVEGEEDPVEEEMNLSLDPEIAETQDSVSPGDVAAEEAQRIGELSLEEMPINAEEMEDQADINLSLDPEEKVEESPSVADEPLEKLDVEESVGASSTISAAEKPGQSDERLEKPPEDDENDDDTSKVIVSTMTRETEIFHDEQSQNTQEMMDSILETDSSNFNKVLDDEEAEIDELAEKLPLAEAEIDELGEKSALEEAEIDELAEKLPSEAEEMLDKALDDPMSSQNTDSLEGLLDLDLMQEGDESTMKSVEPIVAKVMNEAEEDIETKDVLVSLLLEEADQGESVDRDEFVGAPEDSSMNADVLPKVIEETVKEVAATPVESLLVKSAADETINSVLPPQLETAVGNEIDAAFDLPSVEANPVEVDQLASEESKLDLAEDLLREIAVDEERKMELAGDLLLETDVEKSNNKTGLPEDLLENAVQKESEINLADDLLLQTAVEEETGVDLPADVLMTAATEAESGIELVEEVLLDGSIAEDPKMELSEDISLEGVVRDQVLTAAADIEDLPANSEISELESAVKFLQESEEQDIDSPLALSPKLVDSVVDEDVGGIFVADGDICEDPSALVAELESIIPDPIAISEAEIITEAAKLESERKSKLCEEAKLQSPIPVKPEERKEAIEATPPLSAKIEEASNSAIVPHPDTPKTHREPRQTATKLEKRCPSPEKLEQVPLLKKSAPIPKISILEERLKEPPKIEIPSAGEVSRICEMPTTPKTSLLIQRDAKFSSFQKMLDSPKSGSDKTEHKIVEASRKHDADKHDFENVGSPRIILKIAKSAIADCGEPRSPKSPKIRSATNSPNPEDSPGQKLGKIKLKLSKGGHPSIISNENVEEICGQWHTEGTSSLSPLGMKIKFSKTGDASIVQTEKHETAEEAKEPPKHKFEEAKRTDSPIGMKIKFSRSGDASIVQQDGKETSSKHKDKLEMMQGSPKRNESPIGMKIKFSKSGDASIIQPDKSDSSEDHREVSSSRVKEKLDVPQDAPRRTESPLGMKFKLFKTGDASIVASEVAEDSPQEAKRTDSPLGMKIKLSKSRGSASIVSAESSEDGKETRLELPEPPRRTESPLGMKIKFSKSGDASIIHSEDSKEPAKHKERADASHQESAHASEVPTGVKIKVTKSRETCALQKEVSEEAPEVPVAQKRTESSIGMKFKLSKTGDASIVHSEMQEHVEDSRSKDKLESPGEVQRKSDSTAIGMKIKFSKTGDASIIQPQLPKKSEEPADIEKEHQRSVVEGALPMKIKLQRGGDASIVESEKKEKPAKRKDTDSPLEMKIKLSKTGHPTIVACENYGESSQRGKDTATESHKHKEPQPPPLPSVKEMPSMKMLKSMQAGMHGNRGEVTIEPVQLQSRKSEGGTSELSPKRKDVTISPVESKKAKLEAKLSQMLPEVTIQPIMPREPKQIMFDAKASSISRQQMNVISQEISITQVRSNKAMDLSMTNKLKSMLAKNTTTSANADCEIIEHRPELIIVNENSNSSQDVMIIEEVPALRGPDAKVPKKRGRPRRNPIPFVLAKPIQQIAVPTEPAIPRDPLALDDVPQSVPQIPMQIPTTIVPLSLPPKENERPKRSCSRQKSYAPPRRGRRRGGGGRGKRKMEMEHMELSKKPRIEQDLTLIEQSTTALITIDESASQSDISHSTSELYKALRQPPMDHKMANAIARVEAEQAVNDADLLLAKGTRESLMDSRIMSHLDGVIGSVMNKPAEPGVFDAERKMSLESLCSSEGQSSTLLASESCIQMEKTELMIVDEKPVDKAGEDAKDNKDTSSSTQDHQNWLTPSSKRLLDGRNEGNISSVQVIDEETRMSAESSSRSQTPARNMSLQAPETIVNEESQGSVLSTATTESEKVKVKNRRMEINFDPDEGPFTVDKVAEYEWPIDPTRKGETFMIQEQISQYLGVKSFKRKYPDLKRRMVDMEERNYLRENALVSESMCDMGLTAVSSSEVLDVMCNDFPDQYEEYRKYIREKQMKEHSKKQKELTAAANAERNRIDLAEMAVQSALSWNVGLNKARRESRKCSLDLQTFTIHVPKKQQKVEEESRQSHYPVALIPGQYTDYYREYTPAELRYYPLNTVLYGPMKPNERKLDSQSEGSQSDSDSDSSSDDSSSSSSDGTQDTEESQSTMDEVDVELSRQKEDIKSIKCKMCLKHLNKFSRTEVLIQCGTCNGYVHPSCIDLTLDMVPHIQAYAWQCTDCKTCAQCHDPADEDKMLFCDMCDRGYHIYCVGLRRVPQGRWHCQECAVCASCGSREAGGANSDRNSVAQWQHEYKKGDKNTRVYVSTLCVPCSKLWRKGRYCPHCSRCHTVPRLDLEANLVHCSACDKYLHLGCVETKDLTIDRKNYLCDFCQPSRQQMAKPLVSKVFRT